MLFSLVLLQQGNILVGQVLLDAEDVVSRRIIDASPPQRPEDPEVSDREEYFLGQPPCLS